MQNKHCIGKESPPINSDKFKSVPADEKNLNVIFSYYYLNFLDEFENQTHSLHGKYSTFIALLISIHLSSQMYYLLLFKTGICGSYCCVPTSSLLHLI